MKKYLAIVFVILAQQLSGQKIQIQWQQPVETPFGVQLQFLDACANVQHQVVPSYGSQVFSAERATIKIDKISTEPLPENEAALLDAPSFSTSFEVTQSYQPRTQLITYHILPVRFNITTNSFERLVNFELVLVPEAIKPELDKTSSTGDSSVLAIGQWYKLSVVNSGVYKITPQLLVDCGLGSGMQSSTVRLFGNGNGMLSEKNDDNPQPGLKEIPLYMNDGGDGIFNGNDYALFYANGPHEITFDGNDKYSHNYNLYASESYYFLTVAAGGGGKRMQQAGYSPTLATYNSTGFDDYKFLENDLYNLVGAGRQWFGDLFDFTTNRSYNLQFSNVNIADSAMFSARVVGRASGTSAEMRFKINNNPVLNLNVPLNQNDINASAGSAIFIPNASAFQIDVTLNKNGSTGTSVWLDNFAAQVRLNPVFSGSQLQIKDHRAFNQGGVTRFSLSNAPSNLLIWDVTDFNNQRLVPVQNANGLAEFLAPADSLRTFMAISGANFPLPTQVGAVVNQDLMGLENVDMIIVSYAAFVSEANRLATFHQNTQNLNVVVVTPQQIYNEFSSGMQDIMAIKLFFRHLYKKNATATHTFKYALLFGDASYDYKKRMPNDHNLVPIFQSETSFSLLTSYCTDDFFGLLDDGEGNGFYDEDIDIGIGRMPVKTVAEAKNAVDKTIEYGVAKPTYGDWRNRATLVADDVDSFWEREFLTYTDLIAKEFDTIYPVVNFKKIYVDSYLQELKSGSQRYPGAREDLFRSVQRGTLVTSYLGHGGEVGLASERVLQLSDINSWTNFEEPTVFTTVTCEFSRLDDPTRVSAGEQLFLNQNGGAVALFSTLRPVFAGASTYTINQKLFQQLFNNTGGQPTHFGEVVKAVKNATLSGDRIKFALIGDPAIHLPLPIHNVVSDSIFINNKLADLNADTLKALSLVRIMGHLEDQGGSVLSNYQGVLLPTVFDKPLLRQTLNNDNVGNPQPFFTQENIIYKGKTAVKDGYWSFEFVVPLDISFVVGQGKISYYATDSVTDAAGYDRPKIGSLDLTAPPDDKGPEVRLFINDTNFVSGGLTDRNPVGLALISDDNGINTVGTGIGHDIIGVLDGNSAEPLILNDYFEADLGSYKSGTVRFPFFNLNPGIHTLLVRAWDVQNNMGQDDVEFIVDESVELALRRVLNYPNPFHTITYFQFEHNRAGEALEVDIQIFNQGGVLVKRFLEDLVSEGNRVSQISWNGTDESGSPLGSGVYVYRVVVRSKTDGSTATDYSKLVLIK